MKKYPVYVLLTHSGTVIANAIKHVTKNPYSHSSISFDSSLENMYSFGRKYKNSPLIGTFVKEDINSGFYEDVKDTTTYSLYTTFVTREEKDLMIQKLEYFQNQQGFKYDFTGLIKHSLGKISEREDAYFCSGFVATILSSGKDLFKQHYSLVKPYDFAKHKEFHFVAKGLLKNYSSAKVEQKTKQLASEKEFDLVLESTGFSQKLFHLSPNNLDGSTLTPRVPSNWLVNLGVEDDKTPRVSFAPSIDHCLIGMSANLKGKEFFVHEPLNYDEVEFKKVSTSQVPDSKHTKEVWALNPVKLKVVSKIKVIDAIDKPLIYTFGKNQAETYAWNWKKLSSVKSVVSLVKESIGDITLREIENKRRYGTYNPESANSGELIRWHEDFYPSFTPQEMISQGVFGNVYFKDSEKSEFPSSWFKSAPDGEGKDINKYKTDSGMTRSEWVEKGWIEDIDPKGWFQWYCRYFLGRRSYDDERQIKRWKSYVSRHGAQVKKSCGNDETCRTTQRQGLLHWAWNSNQDPANSSVKSINKAKMMRMSSKPKTYETK